MVSLVVLGMDCAMRPATVKVTQHPIKTPRMINFMFVSFWVNSRSWLAQWRILFCFGFQFRVNNEPLRSTAHEIERVTSNQRDRGCWSRRQNLDIFRGYDHDLIDFVDSGSGDGDNLDPVACFRIFQRPEETVPVARYTDVSIRAGTRGTSDPPCA